MPDPHARPRRRLAALAATAVFAACSSTPALPEGTGKGLIAVDTAVPATTQMWQRPEWHVGDRYVLRRGGHTRMEFTVVEADENGYVLRDGEGGRLKRGIDLSNLGEWPAEGDDPRHVLTPADTRFHWPLWLGKRWRCHYSDRTAGGMALPVETAYEVEDLDTIEVPAGTFQALRIVRTSRLLLDEVRTYDRVNVIWYAPDLGLEVRQIIGDTSVELVEWSKAATTAR